MSMLLEESQGLGSQGEGREGQLAIGPANSQPDTVVASMAGDEDRAIGRANIPRSLDAVLREVAEREAGLRREPFPASQIRVEPGRVIAGGRTLRLGDEGLRRLCRRFQAPADYLSRLNSDLRARVLKYHFANGHYADRSLNDQTSCIISRGDTFLDLGRSDLLTLDNTALLQALRDGVGADAAVLEVQNLRLDDESLAIDVVSPRLAEEVRPGDAIRAGVHVRHSQLNGEATQILAYVLRLVCANGLVQRQCLGAKRGSTPRARRLAARQPEARDKQIAQVSRLIADTWGGLQEKLAAIRRLRDKPVPKVGTALERFLRQAHLFSRGLMGQLLQAWEEEGSEATAFGALNALTRVATHAQEMPAWRRQRLARLAGLYANQDVHLCDYCFSVIAAR
jgi:hypothetical protein